MTKEKITVDEKLISAEVEKRFKLLEKNLNLLSDVRKQYSEGIINLCINGMIYNLDEKEKELVKKIESEKNITVYMGILSSTNIGRMYSFLYVSNYPDEWEYDEEDLNYMENGLIYPMSYVHNCDYEYGSEFGSIGIKGLFGGITRVY